MTGAIACLVAWSAGIVLAGLALPAKPGVGVLALLGAALAAVMAVALRPTLLGLAIAAALLGVARAELPPGDPGLAARALHLAGRGAVVTGVVSDDPKPLADGYEALIEPASVAAGGATRGPVGKVLVRVRGLAEPGLGDHVRVTGRLDLPKDLPGFDRRAYLAQQGAYLEMRSASLSVEDPGGGPRALPGWLRERYRQAVSDLVPPPHAQVLVAVVLGLREGIPTDLQRDLVTTGLVHLLVLSGLKVAVFTRLTTAFLTPLLGRASTLPALGLIALYALAGGATPAAVRAAAMGGLARAAARLGRPTHVWTSLAATAAAMLGWRPDLVWDIGFQLSFAGTASIILLTPAIEARLPWLPGPVREPLAVTCAAQVGTAPLMAASFHVISPSAPLANAAVLPLLPALVAGGLMLAPLAALPDLGRLVALPVIGLLRYLEQVAAILAHAPSSAVTVPDVSPATGVAYYLGVGGAMVAARTRGTARRAAVAVAVLGPLIVGAGELVAWDRPQPAVTVLSVGQGQAVLVSGPAGYVLIDGGPNPAHLKNSLGVRLPPWRRRLAALVVTAPLQGHVGGLAELDYPAGVVVLPEGPPGGTAMRTVALEQAARGARPVSAHAGQVLSLAGLRWEVLSPAPAAPDPGQLAFRIVGPDGRAFCDLSDLGLDDQVAAAAWLAGRCDTLLLPGGGRSAPAPELTRAARPGRLIASDPGGRLARDLPAASVSRTSEEGDIVLPL